MFVHNENWVQNAPKYCWYSGHTVQLLQQYYVEWLKGLEGPFKDSTEKEPTSKKCKFDIPIHLVLPNQYSTLPLTFHILFKCAKKLKIENRFRRIRMDICLLITNKIRSLSSLTSAGSIPDFNANIFTQQLMQIPWPNQETPLFMKVK